MLGFCSNESLTAAFAGPDLRASACAGEAQRCPYSGGVCMKAVLIFAVGAVLATGLSGCACRPCNLLPEQMLRASDCEQAIAEDCGIQFSVTTIERAGQLYEGDQLGYVGSDSRYHYFRWFTKIVHYPDQPAGIAIDRAEYTPEDEFRVCEPGRIGGPLFPHHTDR